MSALGNTFLCEATCYRCRKRALKTNKKKDKINRLAIQQHDLYLFRLLERSSKMYKDAVNLWFIILSSLTARLECYLENYICFGFWRMFANPLVANGPRADCSRGSLWTPELIVIMLYQLLLTFKRRYLFPPFFCPYVIKVKKLVRRDVLFFDGDFLKNNAFVNGRIGIFKSKP